MLYFLLQYRIVSGLAPLAHPISGLYPSVPLIPANVNDSRRSAARHYLTRHMPCSALFQWIIPGQSLMARAVYTSHATTWQLFTERSRIYRYLVFGMKFIEFISVVRAIYLVVIFVIAGCSNGNSYTATPPSLRPPHTRPDHPWMLNETKSVWTWPGFFLSRISPDQNPWWWGYASHSWCQVGGLSGQAHMIRYHPHLCCLWLLHPSIKPLTPWSRALRVFCMAMSSGSWDTEPDTRWHLRDGQKTA